MSRAERDMSADAGEVRLWRYRYGPNGEYGEGWDDCKPSCRSADEPIRVDEEFLAFPLAQAEAMLRVVEAAEAWVRAQDAAKAPPYVCLSSHEWMRLCNELQDAVDTLPAKGAQ